MARGMWIGVSGVARKIKNYWIGVDGSGYRLLFNVPTGDTVNIGGDLFTVVNHGYKKYGFSGNTVLWGEEAIGQGTWQEVMSWNESCIDSYATGVDSAFNTTITNLALSNPYSGGDNSAASTNHKFRIIPEAGILSGVSGKRYVNGTAVNHWIQNCGVTTESGWDYDGDGEQDWDVTMYGPYWFYYIDTNGNKVTLRLGESLSDDSLNIIYPDSSHNYHYFYMCEVDGNTKVTYNSNTGYWELFE